MKDSDTMSKLVTPEPLNLIGNEWVPALSGRVMDVVSPIDGQPFAQIADSDAGRRSGRSRRIGHRQGVDDRRSAGRRGVIDYLRQ